MRRSSEERELLGRAAAVLPAGVRNAASSPRCAMLVADAAGARIRDLSGNEYIDYLLGSGPMLLGHAHPRVVEAVTKALQRGSSYLLLNEAAVHLAERIVAAVPCAEQVTLHSSGSEATFFALRLARAFRRRDKILKFEGGFHGMGDVALMSNQWLTPAPGAPQATPVCAGIPRAAAGDVLVAPFNDAEKTVEMIARHAGELAAVIVEPMQRTIPPEPGFLQALREATEHHGVLLVFDEVVTGFRLAYGGAQQYYGVVPDLCALGNEHFCRPSLGGRRWSRRDFASGRALSRRRRRLGGLDRNLQWQPGLGCRGARESFRFTRAGRLRSLVCGRKPPDVGTSRGFRRGANPCAGKR